MELNTHLRDIYGPWPFLTHSSRGKPVPLTSSRHRRSPRGADQVASKKELMSTLWTGSFG
jgi:hypothetical protein